MWSFCYFRYICITIGKPPLCHQCLILITCSDYHCLTSVRELFRVFMNHYEDRMFVMNISLDTPFNDNEMSLMVVIDMWCMD